MFRHIQTVDTTYGVVLDPVREFEQQGWIERGYKDGRKKRIRLTAAGEQGFLALAQFMAELDARFGSRRAVTDGCYFGMSAPQFGHFAGSVR